MGRAAALEPEYDLTSACLRLIMRWKYTMAMAEITTSMAIFMALWGREVLGRVIIPERIAIPV